MVGKLYIWCPIYKPTYIIFDVEQEKNVSLNVSFSNFRSSIIFALSVHLETLFVRELYNNREKQIEG